MTNDFRADLHCHTTCSDGSLTPEQIVALAKEIGLSALSITDHDTVEAYHSAKKAAVEHDIHLLTGVEFSSALALDSVHILGYGFDPADAHIARLCAWHESRRKQRNKEILAKLASLNINISEEELVVEASEKDKAPRHTIGRPHIAQVMVRKGYTTSIQEAFSKYIGDGKRCYVQGDTCSVDDTLEAIHQAKGLAVLAHPHLIKDGALLDKLLQKPFDGIECYYGTFHKSAHERWLKIAQKKNILATGGSDFHGDAKPNQPLGSSWIDKPTFQAIVDRLPSRV